MKKVICQKCKTKRGRRECVRYNMYICGNCCSNIQLNSDCPNDCIHKGKVNTKELKEKIHALIETGIDMREKKPNESIKMFDRALELDEQNSRGLIEKSITYDSLGEFDKSIKCLEEAYSIKNDINIYLNIAAAYKKSGNFQKTIEMLLNYKDLNKNSEAELLLGECFFLTGQYKDSTQCLENVLKNPPPGKLHKNKARALLARSYMLLCNFDKAIEIAELIDEEYQDEKMDILKNAYFASGRMYELLKLMDTSVCMGYKDKFLLLQCALVLKKNTNGSIVSIIDDILKGGCFSEDSFEWINLIAVKIRLLFKELNLRQAYEVFTANETKLINMAEDSQDCYESCGLIAFFLYSVDKKKSLSIYHIITGMDLDEIVLDELYGAFSTMHISVYVMARSVLKSIELIKSGRNQEFSRTSIAADILYELGEYSQAAELYKRFISKDSDTVTLYKFAVSLMNQKLFSDALDVFKNILSLTSFIPGAYSGAIRCCLELGYEWQEYFSKLELEKLSFIEIYDLAKSMASKKYLDKSGYLLSYLIEKYKNIDMYSKKAVYHSMAYVYRNLGNYLSAIKLMDEISKECSDEDVLLDLGSLYTDINELEKGRMFFEKLKSANLAAEAYLNLGILEIKLGNYEGAVDNFNASMECIKEALKEGEPSGLKKYNSILNKIYRNLSICFINMDMPEKALSYMEKALNIEEDKTNTDILSVIQGIVLDKYRGVEIHRVDIDSFCDDCVMAECSFNDGLRNLLDNILNKVYENTCSGKNQIRTSYEDIDSFIKNEKRIYGKNRDSIERYEGTFQRYVDNLMQSFDKRVISRQCEDQKFLNVDNNSVEYINYLIDLGDRMFGTLEFTNNHEYIYASLIPYYKAVKILSKNKILPYYKKNIQNIPIPKNQNEFRYIGIYYYNIGKDKHYRIDFSYNISCSRYLLEINCHPGIRSKYFDYTRNYMPWDKFMWMISGIKRKWEVVDDAKSAGLMLLFYAGYKNYLGIDGDFDDRDEIIMLAGDLIHFSNERDYCIRSMLSQSFEFDCMENAYNIRELALKCINGLNKIKNLD